METRKITIINSRTQSQRTIESTATNLGELKEELRQAGIDYEGMTFYEGHMRAELVDDASVLPEEIDYKGSKVRDLIFMLTTPNKNIKSGIKEGVADGFVNYTRAYLYDKIHELHLENKIKEVFGKNFTQVSSDALKKIIDEFEYDKKVKEAIEKVDNNTCHSCGQSNIKKAFKLLVELLEEEGCILEIDGDEVLRVLNEADTDDDTNDEEKSNEKLISTKDIDEMFDFINK